MILVIDVGNSQTVIGIFEKKVLKVHWRIPTMVGRTADEFRILFASLFREDGFRFNQIRGCCISSVVPPMNLAIQEACQRIFEKPLVMVEPGIRTGLPLMVDNPKEVGADRIANCVAAIEDYHAPLIVIDFGTATTFDVVSSKGEFCGGAIFPGVGICAETLFERCAKLPKVDIVVPSKVIGRDTISNMRSGLTYGYAAMVEGMVRRITDELGDNATVIATGGLASLFVTILHCIHYVDPYLTLKGLRILFERNTKGDE